MKLNSFQLVHTFLCSSQNYQPEVLRMADAMLTVAKERYEVVVLLPNSKQTKDNNTNYAMLMHVRYVYVVI